MRASQVVVIGVAAWTAVAGCADEDDVTEVTVEALVNPPGDAIFAPADYDGDGLTDFAVKGGNVWYIDVARCSVPAAPETACDDYIDNDLDGLVNDGCPAKGAAPESGVQCAAPYGTSGDEDADGYIDDGCPTNRQCLGSDGFGGRWDYAYAGYGDNTAIPIPADYGSIAGPADGRADLAIKDASGMFAIDYADNGFGSFDHILTGYGGANAVPWIGDFDGDGRTDLSIRTNDGSGLWYFDYSSDGFGGWDIPCTSGCPCSVAPGAGYAIGGYGGGGDLPAIGDFNGDSCSDLAVKTPGGWYFDLHGDGFGWQQLYAGMPIPLSGYGNNTNVPIVANYDPDYDDKADLAVHTADGYWAIDFAADGFGAWNTPFYGAGVGSAAGRLIPGHYVSTSGNLDQGIKPNYGYWFLDYGYDGYGGWNEIHDTIPVLADKKYAYIDSMYISQPTVPAGATTGNFSEVPVIPSQLKVGVRYTANIHIDPGAECMTNADDDADGFRNDGCPVVGAAETACSDAVDSDGDTFINDGCPVVGASESSPDQVSIRVNPDVKVPASLNPADVGGHTTANSTIAAVYPHYRRFAFTCSRWGNFPLGYMLSLPHSSAPLNVDYGVGVTCNADFPGIYGWVKNKRTGAAIPNAVITVDNLPPFPADGNGFWKLQSATGGPHKVVISKAGFETAEAINITVPPYGLPAGIQVDAALEEAFVLPAGITYRTFIDYSRGRTLLHTVTVDVTQAPVTLGKVPQVAGDFQPLLALATAQNAPVMVNGIWWTLATPSKNFVKDIGSPTCSEQVGPTFANTRAIGYLYINGFVSPGACGGGVCRPADVECSSGKMYADPVPGRPATAPPVLIQDVWKVPMFGIKGSGTARRASILMTDTDFMSSTLGWKRVAGIPSCPAGNACPIYDAVAPTNQSDFDFAFQMGHVLLFNAKVIARGIHAEIGTAFPGEFAFSRTAIGVNAAGTRVFLVIADGEGIDGGHGGTPNQLGAFYRDTLGASAAMIVDSGESTELILRGSTGPRRVNTLGSENSAADGIAPNGDFTPSGRVFSFIKAGT